MQVQLRHNCLKGTESHFAHPGLGGLRAESSLAMVIWESRLSHRSRSSSLLINSNIRLTSLSPDNKKTIRKLKATSKFLKLHLLEDQGNCSLKVLKLKYLKKGENTESAYYTVPTSQTLNRRNKLDCTVHNGRECAHPRKLDP